jgi:hypothetical protein
VTRHRMLGAAAAVFAILYSGEPAYSFTQADCDGLAKTQNDPAGRQIVTKLHADAKGACLPEAPGKKEPKAPRQKRT